MRYIPSMGIQSQFPTFQCKAPNPFGSDQEETPVIVESTAEVLAIREEVLKEMEEKKQQIKDTKGIWLRHTQTCHMIS